MLQYVWISKHCVEQKNPVIKGYLTTWFCFYEVQEEAKLSCSDRNQKNGSFSAGLLTGKGIRKFSVVIEMLTWVMVTWVYTFVKTLQTIHLRSIHFALCKINPHVKRKMGTSLVARWLGIHLPLQGTRVPALVQEDPTRHGATKPVLHNYWACTLEPTSHNYWAHVPQLLKLVHLEPMLCKKRSHHNEKPEHCNEE